MLLVTSGKKPVSGPPSTNLFKHWKLNTGLTQSGGYASAWADQIGGTSLSQSNASCKPAVQGDGSLLFDGSNDAMDASFTRSNPETLYILCKHVTWRNDAGLTDGGNYARWISGKTTTPQIQMYGGASLLNTNLAVNTWGVVCAVWNGASSVFQIDATTAVTGNPGNTTPTTFVIGGHAANGNCGNWQIKEILMYSAAHDATARAAVRDYLATIP